MAVKCEARANGHVTYFLKGAPERISAACREDGFGIAVTVITYELHLAQFSWNLEIGTIFVTSLVCRNIL